jgi:hypothetical protein
MCWSCWSSLQRKGGCDCLVCQSFGYIYLHHIFACAVTPGTLYYKGGIPTYVWSRTDLLGLCWIALMCDAFPLPCIATSGCLSVTKHFQVCQPDPLRSVLTIQFERSSMRSSYTCSRLPYYAYIMTVITACCAGCSAGRQSAGSRQHHRSRICLAWQRPCEH